MSDIPLVTRSTIPVVHGVGVIAILTGIISAIGVVFLIAMFILFMTPYKELAMQAGMANDICVALQYLLTIPVALTLYPLLRAFNPALLRIATIVGIAAMLLVTGLQLLLIFKVLTFEQQGLWVTLVMIFGVGYWLIITGLAARSTGKLPNSLLMSFLAVTYLGYPVWAIWIGVQLLAW